MPSSLKNGIETKLVMLVPLSNQIDTDGSGARVASPAREGELFPKENRSAMFSDCGKYRYTLKIVWDENLSVAQFIGLNPSTADEFKDDPTLRRVKAFARSWGYGGVIMNLFAYRATDPKVMRAFPNPIGAMNNATLIATSEKCAIVIAAWGHHGSHMDRNAWATANIPHMKCLWITGSGHPAHPLYLPGHLTPIPFT